MKINSSRSQKELKAEIARLRQELDALKKSRAAGLAAVIHDSADGILVIDQGGSVCLSNPEAERILRRRGDDLVGSPLGIPAYGGERTEVDILTPDGDRVPVELWTRDTIWAGEPAIRVSLRDLTVQRKAESALRESEARYRILAESTLDCIWIMAPDLTITYVNPAVQRLFGYTPEEYTGTALARHCDPAQLARIQEIVETELAKPTGSDGVTLETVLKHRDGHSVPVEITATIIYDDTGGLLHFQGVTRDITERKKAFEREQRLAAIVRSSKDAIVSKTVDGIITSWNAGAEAMYGYTAAEAVGKHIDMLVPPDVMAELDGIFKQIAAGRSAGALETVRLTKGGKRLPVWLTVSPIHDEDGRVIGASSVARDISDLKETLDALHRSEALLNETGDMARVGGWEIDLQTETVYWTQTIRRIHEVPEDYVPDLLVTDVVMPGMSGKVVAERLKKRLPDLKVLYMSGYTDNAIVHHGVLDADTPFIQKPVTKAALGKAVRQVLDAD